MSDRATDKECKATDYGIAVGGETIEVARTVAKRHNLDLKWIISTVWLELALWLMEENGDTAEDLYPVLVEHERRIKQSKIN